MPLLAGVLLRHLQLDRQPGLRHRGDHRGDRLARLEVHRAVLDLQDHVVVEPAVERREVVVRRPGAVGGPVAPVLVVVVDERAPVHDAAERRQRPASRFAPSAWSRPYANGPGCPSESAFTTNPPKSGIGLVDAGRRVAPTTAARRGRAGRPSPDRRGRSARRSSPTGARGCRTAGTRRPAAATSSRRSVSSRASAACTLTLFSADRVDPDRRRAAARTARPGTGRRATRPSAQKIEPPAYPRSTWPITGCTSTLSQWSSMRISLTGRSQTKSSGPVKAASPRRTSACSP